MSLAEAREKAGHPRKVTKEGLDPRLERGGKKETGPPSFAETARQVYAELSSAWKNPKHRHQWINTMQAYVFPVIGGQPVDQISSHGVLEVLQPIWLGKPEPDARCVRACV